MIVLVAFVSHAHAAAPACHRISLTLAWSREAANAGRDQALFKPAVWEDIIAGKWHGRPGQTTKEGDQKRADRSHDVGERLGAYVTVARVVVC